MPPANPEVAEAVRKAREVVDSALSGACGDSLCEAVRDLYASFPRRGWLVRATARLLMGTVRRSKVPWLWYVDGVRDFGDRQAVYLVELVSGEGYRCSCHKSLYGYRRRARVCTHAAAVMLYRRQLQVLDFLGG